MAGKDVGSGILFEVDLLKSSVFPFLAIYLYLTPFSLLADDSWPLSDLARQKAIHLFNFTRYIDWPDFSERDLRSEIIICLQDNSQSFDFLTDLASGEKVGKRQLAVQITVLEKDTRCDMVYIEQVGFFEDETQQQRLQEVLVVASNTDLYPDFAAIAFYEQKKSPGFEMKMNKINSLKLKVRSELLKLARIKQ